MTSSDHKHQLSASSFGLANKATGNCLNRCKQPMSEDELKAFLALLVEALRAASRVAAIFASRESDNILRDIFLDIQQKGAKSAAQMLGVLKQRGGGEPALSDMPFFEQALVLPPDADKIAFFTRGQCWLIERLRDAAAHVEDPALVALFGDKASAIEQSMRRFAALPQASR